MAHVNWVVSCHKRVTVNEHIPRHKVTWLNLETTNTKSWLFLYILWKSEVIFARIVKVIGKQNGVGFLGITCTSLHIQEGFFLPTNIPSLLGQRMKKESFHPIKMQRKDFTESQKLPKWVWCFHVWCRVRRNKSHFGLESHAAQLLPRQDAKSRYLIIGFHCWLYLPRRWNCAHFWG